MKTRIRVPRCSKNNPNPRMLIPWLPVGKGDWTLQQVHDHAMSRHFPTRQQVDGKELQLVCVLIDGIWWDFILSSSCNEVVRRPRLAKFPSTTLTYPTDEGPKPIKVFRPSFVCQVCGRYRPENEARPVQCGVDRWHSDEFLVCIQCIDSNALLYSRRMGYFVAVKATDLF